MCAMYYIASKLTAEALSRVSISSSSSSGVGQNGAGSGIVNNHVDASRQPPPDDDDPLAGLNNGTGKYEFRLPQQHPHQEVLLPPQQHPRPQKERLKQQQSPMHRKEHQRKESAKNKSTNATANSGGAQPEHIFANCVETKPNTHHKTKTKHDKKVGVRHWVMMKIRAIFYFIWFGSEFHLSDESLAEK